MPTRCVMARSGDQHDRIDRAEPRGLPGVRDADGPFSNAGAPSDLFGSKWSESPRTSGFRKSPCELVASLSVVRDSVPRPGVAV
jgi:hypothetical protein